MGEIVIACYRPKPGKERELLDVVGEHVPTLRKLDLATDRPVTVMRAGDGTVVEVFEWVSAAATERAHHDPTVKKMWDRFAEVCDFVPITAIPGVDRPFPHFTPVD